MTTRNVGIKWLTYLLLAHGADDGNVEVLTILEIGHDLFAKITLRDLDIVLRDTF